MFENNENKTELKEKIKKVITKIGKRNLIIVMSVLLIGGAVYLNWRFFLKDNVDDQYTDNSQVLQNETDAVKDIPDEEENYFTSAQINRQKARDEAIEVFRLVADSNTALEESKSAALDEINKIAANIEQEANIETLICSKGFSECIAVINDGTAEIVVKSSGLMNNEIAQIQEIVYEQAGIVPKNVKIIENR